jgi:hypothetical protein
LRNGLAQMDRLTSMFQKWSDQLVGEPAPNAAKRKDARKA